MWTADDFLMHCTELDGSYCCDEYTVWEQLEMMTLGTITAEQWDDIGVLEIGESEFWIGRPFPADYLREVYGLRLKKLWDDAGVPEAWWNCTEFPRITCEQLVLAFELVDSYAEAIESGVPINDILA